ncbi:MAG: GTP-binding protein [Alphaproteobacteria bacterium]|nr:GTP-binding protein [Alphaproteobacteria bacterium]
MTSPRSEGDRVPASVLTGFLGSGKTTLLNHLLRRPELGTAAVIVNEIGAVGIDNLLVEEVAEDVVLLESGCLCCTLRSDLLQTIERLFERRASGAIPRFDRLLIETSGLADPAAVLQTFMAEPGVVAQSRLDGVIVTVDAVHGEAQLAARREAIKQVALADRLLLTKTDLASAPAQVALRARVRALNPRAPLRPALHGMVEPAALFDAGLYDPATRTARVAAWLRSPPHDHAHDPASAIRTFCLTIAEPVALAAVMGWLETLTAFHGAEILRLKGIIHVAGEDRPLVVHGVHHLFHPPAWLPAWPPGGRETRLVFIAENLAATDVAAGAVPALRIPSSAVRR